MADDIPIGGGQQPGMFKRIDQGLNNFFGPINRGIESVTGKPNPTRNLLAGLGAVRPGGGPMALPVAARTPSMGVPSTMYLNAPEKGVINQPINAFSNNQVVNALRGSPDFPMPAPTARPPMQNQPGNPPPISRLIHQMLAQRAQSPGGIMQDTRTTAAHNPNLRPQTFMPNIEQQLAPGDAIFGTNVMTPANRTPNQSYNLALIKQLLGRDVQ